VFISHLLNLPRTPKPSAPQAQRMRQIPDLLFTAVSWREARSNRP
jgi:hypothetical protein